MQNLILNESSVCKAADSGNIDYLSFHFQNNKNEFMNILSESNYSPIIHSVFSLDDNFDTLKFFINDVNIHNDIVFDYLFLFLTQHKKNNYISFLLSDDSLDWHPNSNYNLNSLLEFSLLFKNYEITKFLIDELKFQPDQSTIDKFNSPELNLIISTNKNNHKPLKF